MAGFLSTDHLNTDDTVLVTDQLSSSSDFLLHRFLAAHTKDTNPNKSREAIVLSISEHITKWTAVASRSNTNLAQLINSKVLTFLDVVSWLPRLPHIPKDTVGSLRPLLDEIHRILIGSGQPAAFMVILDDLSSLEWIGVPTQDLQFFVRALAALCNRLNATLLIRHHVIVPEDPDDLLRLLLQLCTCHIDVFPLSTGRSGTVSGQIALHAGAAMPLKESFKPIPRTNALQYKLTDSGCVFFERGTSSSVL